MAERVACLHHGKVEVVLPGQPSQSLESPYQKQRMGKRAGQADPRIVSVTRGRTNAELCYAIRDGAVTRVFAQVPGSGTEQQLFQGADTDLGELDFSVADEALACSVSGPRGTSAIAVLSDDGKGLRTVTEGDVIDRSPRWAPGGRGEIVYASAGIARTKAGRAVGRSAFALHRLRFNDQSVEVLLTDAAYDYVAAVPISDSLLYALRRRYDGAPKGTAFTRIFGAFRGLFSGDRSQQSWALTAHELLRVTPKGSQLIARDVLAFDVAGNQDIVYSSGAGVFRIAPEPARAQAILALEHVEQLVIYG